MQYMVNCNRGEEMMSEELRKGIIKPILTGETVEISPEEEKEAKQDLLDLAELIRKSREKKASEIKQ